MFRLIIADDEVIERKVLHRKLERFFGGQLEIREAANGREVLTLYQEQRADILILDIQMPGLTGLDAAAEIRKTDRECRIIFLTAYDDFSYARKAISVRALDYLLKPCEDRELQAALEEAMRLEDPAAAAGNPDAEDAGGRNGAAPEKKSGNGKKGLSEENSIQLTIRGYIEANFMRDISVQDAAGQLGYSEAYFCRLFKQYFGQSFVSFLTDYRISEAVRLLKQPEVSVREIARAVGYSDPNYFTKVFKRITGQNPTDYRSGCTK